MRVQGHYPQLIHTQVQINVKQYESNCNPGTPKSIGNIFWLNWSILCVLIMNVYVAVLSVCRDP